MDTLDTVEQIAPEENSFARMRGYLEQAGFEFWTTCRGWDRDAYRRAYGGAECCLIPINVRKDGEALSYGVFTRRPENRLYDTEPVREDLSLIGYTLVTNGFSEELPKMLQGLEGLAQQRLGRINGHGGRYEFKIAVFPFNPPTVHGTIEPYSYAIYGLISKSPPRQRLTPPPKIIDVSADIAPAAPPVARVSGNARTRTLELLSRLMPARRSNESPRVEA